MSTVKLDEQGRIVLIGKATDGSILLKKKDLRAILEGIIKEALHVDLDKLERDAEDEGNRIAREKYKIFAGH